MFEAGFWNGLEVDVGGSSAGGSDQVFQSVGVLHEISHIVRWNSLNNLEQPDSEA